jgi:molybdopterin/thiamine biosynthesis adenylyltransferase
MFTEPAIEEPGDRHLLGLRREQKRKFYPGCVRVRVSTEIATSHNGQLILWWLANLLARQFNVVSHIEFDVPAVPMRPGIALFGYQPGLSETLVRTVAQIAGQTVAASIASTAPADIILNVDPRFTKCTDRDYAIWGEGWRCAAAAVLDVPVGVGHVAIGPMLAATLGAAEAFQRITDWQGEGRMQREPLHFSAWDGKAASEWAALRDGPSITELSIEPFYLCGAGAVGQALAATLSYFPERSGHTVILDGDPLDDTNLNRYCLSHRDSPPGKAEACRAILESTRFTVDAQSVYWEKYQELPVPRTNSPILNAFEAAFKYRLIISCVDKNVARHALQNFWPRLILGGSTSGLTTKLSSYDCATGECLKCSNPLPVYPTIEEEAQILRNMTQPDRETVLGQLPPKKAAAVRAYLADPGCGHAAEQYLTELGEIRRREFSVGFVSVASGIFLAVALIQRTLGIGDLAQGDANHFSFSFLSRKPGREFFTRENSCECAGTGGVLFRHLWLN